MPELYLVPYCESVAGEQKCRSKLVQVVRRVTKRFYNGGVSKAAHVRITRALERQRASVRRVA